MALQKLIQLDYPVRVVIVWVRHRIPSKLCQPGRLLGRQLGVCSLVHRHVLDQLRLRHSLQGTRKQTAARVVSVSVII